METTTNLDTWAVVALFGHTKISGKVTTVTLGSAVMIRVDVPETKTMPVFHKFYNTSAIYDITPTDEETAKFVAEELAATPLPDTYSINRAVHKLVTVKMEEEKQRAFKLPEQFRDE